jgi:ADP-ribosylglycohydrolase
MKSLITDTESDIEALPLTERFRGAVWGQFIGDAACLGTHCIYDLDEMNQAFPEGIHGFETPAKGHRHFGKKSGDQTHYGEGAIVLLDSVAALGHFDPVDFGQRFVAHFGSASYQGYLDTATQGTLEGKAAFEKEHAGQPFPFRNGADDDQSATVSRLAPLVVAHFGHENLLERVEAATRVCQNNDRAVAYAQAHGVLLVELFEGRDIHSALHWTAEHMGRHGRHGEEVVDKIRLAAEDSQERVTEATLRFGQSCPLANSFPAAVQALVRKADDFREAILAVIRAGGDNAGRSAMVGAWLGAALGYEAIPEDWIARLTAREHIQEQLERLIAGMD